MTHQAIPAKDVKVGDIVCIYPGPPRSVRVVETYLEEKPVTYPVYIRTQGQKYADPYTLDELILKVDVDYALPEHISVDQLKIGDTIFYSGISRPRVGIMTVKTIEEKDSIIILNGNVNIQINTTPRVVPRITRLVPGTYLSDSKESLIKMLKL